MREEIKKTVENSIKALQKERKLSDFEIPEVLIESPKESAHGDYSCNIALVLSKIIKKNPKETADLLISTIKSQESRLLERVEPAGPGFINFFVSKECLQKQIGAVVKQKNKFGDLKIGNKRKVNIEFISANPTGPLTLGNGRGGFCGDVLANVMEKAGYGVKREYYLNDIGAQIKKLGHSVLGDAEAVYKGKYIDELRKKIKGQDPEKVGKKSAQIILKQMIKPSVKKMGIKFDVWFSEESLYKKNEVDKIIGELSKKGFTYESEKAIWFKSKGIGDDKDRVLVRADGIKTYFASDIAYLKNKFNRGFGQLVFFLGADHYGYVARLEAAAIALGYSRKQIKPIVMQLVRLFEKGKEVRMSKRTGIYITIDELINEVGLDVARFFFLTRSPNTHLNFNMDLAKKQSKENPVYYVQYAYARICSILKKAPSHNAQHSTKSQALNLLKEPEELELIKRVIKFPEVIEDTAKDYQVQRLPQYAVDLADSFHKFYEKCQVITDNKELTLARLSLVLGVKIVLKNTFDLMGVSAPEKM